MKYVITGATSFVGNELMQLLLENGEQVVAVCRPNSKALYTIPSTVEIVKAEMSEYSKLYEKIPTADVFINLAWEGTGHDGRNQSNIQANNIRNTVSAFKSARKIGCKLFVEAGSQAEYGTKTDVITENSQCNPFSEYGRAKLEVEKQCSLLSKECGLRYLHLRIFSLFGEKDHPWTLVMSCLSKMLNDEPVDLSLCTQNWNFLYVKDAAKQIYLLCRYALRSDYFVSDIYNIASENTRCLKDFIEKMKSITKSLSQLNYGAIVPPNIVSLQPDISKTKSAIGFISEKKFEEVIELIIKEYKNKNYDKSF